ncbi:MAG: M1 family metallopeptidase [Flavobacteriales bacterium]
MKRLLFFSILTSVFSGVFAQENYFQQEVNYKIDVTLDDKKDELSGHIEFEYTNNSSDTLREMYIHLWPNAYKNDKTALAKQQAREGNYYLSFAINKAKGRIDSLEFKVDGQLVNFEYFEKQEDIAHLTLPQALAPGAKIKIATPFHVVIPIGTISRLGHIGQSYQITQWYPKPAVYDKDGWHPIPYLNQGEFYSEFGTFDVSITLPENYIVGSTGELQTQNEIDRLNTLSSTPAPVQPSNEFPKSSESMKTLRYTASKVHDFGWFADKRWIVRKGEVTLPQSGRKVTTWAMYTPGNAEEWEKGVSYINEAITSYSEWVGDYPYSQCTAVDGTISAGGGMEYPMVTVIGSTHSDFELETVIVHEVGHNWFYGILGTNERINGWMDEGINSFMETLTMEAAHPEARIYDGILGRKMGEVLGIEDMPYNYQNEIMYQLFARVGGDQPIQTNSIDFTSGNYGSVMYKKTGLAFNYLKNYLGDDLFKQCMHSYFDTWKFKHPTPADIKKTFESTSNKNLDWFFEDVIKTDKVIDYKIAKVKESNEGYSVVVFNAGLIDAPFSISVEREGKIVSTKWVEGIEEGNWSSYIVEDIKKGDVILLNNQPGSLDVERSNNRTRTTGAFRKIEPITLKFFAGVEDPEKTQLFWLPAVGWNNYDKWMLGATLHNQTVPLRKFNFSITPMYSISENRLVGVAKIEGISRNITQGIRAKRFTQYTGNYRNTSYLLLNPYLQWNSKKGSSVSNWSSFIRGDLFFNRITAITDFENIYYKTSQNYSGVKISGEIKKGFIGGEWSLNPSYIGMVYDEFVMGHTVRAQTSATFTYWKRKKRKVIAKAFGGLTAGDIPYPLQWSGTAGSGDVFNQYLFFGRSEFEGLLSNQIISNQGGVLMPISQYSFGAPQKMGTIYLEADIPVKLPLSIFAGAGFAPNQDMIWSAGASIPIVRGFAQIYVPLMYSSNIQSIVDRSNFGWQDYIMFELNLDLVNPFEFLKGL